MASSRTVDPDLRAMLEAMEARLDSKITTMGAHLDSKITTMESRLDSKITAMEARLDSKITTTEARLDSKITTIQDQIDNAGTVLAQVSNRDACEQNSRVTSKTADLVPLRSKLNRIVEACPTTIADLEAITGNNATQVLRELELPSDGRLDQKRARIMIAMGIPARVL